MAPQDYKIVYRDGATQTVKAARYRTEGDMIVFYDGRDSMVLSVRSDDVQSISRSDVADRVTPGPMFA